MLSGWHYYNVGEVDHGSLEQQLTFSTSMGRQCFNISITDDDEVEEDELFRLTLSDVSRTAGNTTAYQLNISTATITIIDDDCKFVFMCSNNITVTCSLECVNGYLSSFLHLLLLFHLSVPPAEVGLEKTFYNVSESEGEVEICVNASGTNVSCPSPFTFQVTLSTTNRSAGTFFF